MTDFRDTRLVQRLQKPRGYVNPFSFGGGLKNGGLSDEAFDLLKNVVSFDYMGAAEYEFGAVPEAFNKIAKSVLLWFEMSIGIKDGKVTTAKNADTYIPVYIICSLNDAGSVKARILELAQNKCRLKMGSGFPGALIPRNEWDGDNCGWLELDNGFMFFTDHNMYVEMGKLFGVER